MPTFIVTPGRRDSDIDLRAYRYSTIHFLNWTNPVVYSRTYAEVKEKSCRY